MTTTFFTAGIEDVIREHDVLAAPSQANKQEDEMTSEAGPKYLEAQS